MLRSPRLLSALLFVAGLAIGTLADRLPERVVPRSGESWILSGDFHVHVFPGDGSLPPTELPREAARAGLDVIAVTSHNVTWPARLARWRAGGDGPIVLVGQEITNPAYHMIGAGLTGTVNWWQPAAAAIAEVHRHGGVAIAAHPSRGSWAGFDANARALLDGSEFVDAGTRPGDPPPRDYVSFYDAARAHNPRLARIASTDTHGAPPVGSIRTYIVAREPSEAGVLEAIRNGRTVAAGPGRALHGDPELVRLVEANRPAGRVDMNPGWRRFAVALAWVGVLGMVLFRSPRKVTGRAAVAQT